jgi:hypothetical protein
MNPRWIERVPTTLDLPTPRMRITGPYASASRPTAFASDAAILKQANDDLQDA